MYTLIQPGKTNLKYIIIFIGLVLIIYGGILGYQKLVYSSEVFFQKPASIPALSPAFGDKPVDWTKSPFPFSVSSNSEFQKYIEELLKSNPELKLSGFTKEKARPFDYDKVLSVCVSLDETDLSWDFSPDKTKAISTLQSFGSPDSDLDFYMKDKNNNSRMGRIETCGTPCIFLNAFWLNNEQFVFIQNREDYNCHEIEGVYRCESNCVVSVYDIPSNTEMVYIQNNPCKNNPWWEGQCKRAWGEDNSYCQR